MIAFPDPPYTTPPALLDAGDDRTLHPAAAKVLLWCHRHLSFAVHVPVKASGVGPALRMRRETVSRALRALVRDGYLHAGPRDGAIPTYRLVPERSRRR